MKKIFYLGKLFIIYLFIIIGLLLLLSSITTSFIGGLFGYLILVIGMYFRSKTIPNSKLSSKLIKLFSLKNNLLKFGMIIGSYLIIFSILNGLNKSTKIEETNNSSYDNKSYSTPSYSSSCSPYQSNYSNSNCNSYSSYITDECRDYIFQRDYYTCQCKCGTHSGNLEVDHIYPKSLGGKNGADNLQLLCRKHNARKSNKLDYSCD